MVARVRCVACPFVFPCVGLAIHGPAFCQPRNLLHKGFEIWDPVPLASHKRTAGQPPAVVVSYRNQLVSRLSREARQHRGLAPREQPAIELTTEF